ncbi:hypothetical protein V495_00825 [Pseudogymnoascus sp. VKM F-4514 (FW-929)]|nr:hypothetical protein V495_00825 [Pseudogymnoascus sp. VKM F-4514 (FW-929)]KFY65155.1 hypothetical protein V497_01485 [Pseudogymnoascus sp. VKM F-4516 (FW-969)]
MPREQHQGELALEIWNALYKDKDSTPTVLAKQIIDYKQQEMEEEIARLERERDDATAWAKQLYAKEMESKNTAEQPVDDPPKTTESDGKGIQTENASTKSDYKDQYKAIWPTTTVNRVGPTIHLHEAEHYYKERNMQGLVDAADNAVRRTGRSLTQKQLAEAWVWLGAGHCFMDNLNYGIRSLKKALEILETLDPKDKEVEKMTDVALMWKSDIKDPAERFDTLLQSWVAAFPANRVLSFVGKRREARAFQLYDPFTATLCYTIVGIVANIVQLVDFSTTVLARLNDFQSTLGEIPKAFRHIKAELPVLQETLKQTKGKIDDGAVEDSTRAALLPAVQGCKIQIEALDGLLAEVLPVAGDSRFKKTTKALWSITQDSKAESITKALRGYIATLTFYHAAMSSTLQPIKDTKLIKIRRWLSATDPSINYRNAIKLLTQDILLYCANDPGKVVAYFYFDFTDADKQKPELMIRSLISQLSEQCIRTPLALEALYSSCDKGNRQPSLGALMNVLEQMLLEFPQSYLILDALDECANRAELLSILEQIARWQLEEMRVLVTSRKERDIESSLNEIVNKECIICLQHQVVDKDIQTYVRQRLSNDKGLKKWQRDVEIRQEIETALTEGSCGMFRWAVCQMDTLGGCRSRLALRTALKTLPTTLDETYKRILCAISDKDSEYAIRILQWLAFSSRPLSVEELAKVVAIDVERETAFDRDEVLEDPMEVLDICMSLVSVVLTEGLSSSELSRHASTAVTLAHYSVQEYLVSPRICQGHAARYSIRSAACHGYIAKGSIGYLLQHEKGLLDRFESARSFQQVYTLAQYSAEHWITHTQKGEEEDNQLSYLTVKFLSTGDGAYLNWLRLYDPDDLWVINDFKRELDSCFNPLYYISLGGLANIASRLIEEGADVNAQGGGYGNALQAASARGNDKIVEVLLNKGADVNAQGGHYGNALQAASARGRNKIVDVLLSKGANINAQGGVYGNALQAASNGGHSKIVDVLLSNGINVNAQGGHFGNALQAASFRGHNKIVDVLLSKDTNVNAQGGHFGNALQAASFNGRNKIVDVLLSKGTNVNAQGGRYGNALQAAIAGGHSKIAKELLSKGAV